MGCAYSVGQITVPGELAAICYTNAHLATAANPALDFVFVDAHGPSECGQRLRSVDPPEMVLHPHRRDWHLIAEMK